MPFKDLIKRREYAKEYFHKNRSRIVLKRSTHNLDLIRKHAGHVRRKYGISQTEYNDLVAKYHNCCAICSRPAGKRRLHVDHDHASGKVRGILCLRCNFMMYALDNPDWFEKATKYKNK